ncbi:MAG: DnaJ domain-containing protein, partial [Deltaproteobacteria bacterium]|nr:DnaJ domain-containing protein [Deltaproteobacteria bacterium]
MASRKDYYDILGIRRNATDEEIGKAYRKLTRTYQFDLYPVNKTAESRLKEIFEAYEILSNKEKRARYDRSGDNSVFADPFWGTEQEEEQWEEEQGSRWEGFEDVFEHYFRARQDIISRPPQKGKNLFCPIEIAFEKSIQEALIEVQVERESPCPTCLGKGVNPDGPQRRCEPCGGAGQIQVGLPPATFLQKCIRCEGTGKIHIQHCHLCSGKGWAAQKEAVFLKIPAGINSGCRIYRKGMGHASRQGGSPGDFIAQIEVKPHPYFRRKGNDIYIDVPLAAWEAGLGAEIDIPTLDGLERLRI